MDKTYDITVTITVLGKDDYNAVDIATARLRDAGLTYIVNDTKEIKPRYRWTMNVTRSGWLTVEADTEDILNEMMMEMDDEVIDDCLTSTNWEIQKVVKIEVDK